jgi:hypothetical protein
MRTLLAAPHQAPAYLQRQMRSATPEETREFGRWVAKLDSPRFAVRQQAIERLGRAGELAEPVLRQVRADQPSLEMRRRIDQLPSRLANGSGLRSLRVLEVLEHPWYEGSVRGVAKAGQGRADNTANPGGPGRPGAAEAMIVYCATMACVSACGGAWA